MEGSVRQYKPNGVPKPNVWHLIYDLPRGADGKRKRKWVTFKGTKKAADKELARLVREAEDGTYIEEKITLAELYVRWFRDIGKRRLNPKTLHDYEKLTEWYILPHLGHYKLEALRATKIQEIYSALQDSGGKNKQGLSPTTVRHVHALLSVALKHAVKCQLLARNPLDGVEQPPQTKEKPAILEDVAAIRALTTAARGTWLHIPIALAVSTGLRRGEVLALQWRDVNLDEGTLEVRASTYQLGSDLTTKAPKTQAGARSIDLPEDLVTALRVHKSEQARGYLREGAAPSIRYVVANDDGSQRTPDNLSHAFAKLAAKVGCPQVTYHALRHTCASYLLEQGHQMHEVAEILGHADPTTTARIYAHVTPRMKKRSAITLNGLIGDDDAPSLGATG